VGLIKNGLPVAIISLATYPVAMHGTVFYYRIQEANGGKGFC
jgi:hypothetical protein